MITFQKNVPQVIEIGRTIDVTSTEAFLVRKDGDGGDIFVVDTTNGIVAFGGATPVSGTRITVPSENDAATPTVAFGDGDSGLYEISDDKVAFAIAGSLHSTFSNNGSLIGVVSGTPQILMTAAGSLALPTYAILNDSNTGWWGSAADAFQIVAGGVAAVTYTENTGVLMTNQVNAGLTADAGSAQGGTPLTSSVNQVSTVATIGDSVTLPTAVAGHVVTIINTAANACDVFPASGDNLGAGVDTAASLAGGANITYRAYDATNWFAVT